LSSIQIPSTTEYTGLYTLLEQQLEDLDPEQLVWKQTPESWSIAEVLGHLVDASIVHYYRARKIAAEPTYTGWALYEQDNWVSVARANRVPAEESISAFRKVADYNGLFYQQLSAEDWEKSKLTDKGEEVTLRKHFDNFINHTHIHLRQIERIKRALQEHGQARTGEA